MLPGYSFTDLVTVHQMLKAMKDGVHHAAKEYGRFVEEFHELQREIESLGDPRRVGLGALYDEMVRDCLAFIEKHRKLNEDLDQGGISWKRFGVVYKKLAWETERKTILELKDRINRHLLFATTNTVGNMLPVLHRITTQLGVSNSIDLPADYATGKHGGRAASLDMGNNRRPPLTLFAPDAALSPPSASDLEPRMQLLESFLLALQDRHPSDRRHSHAGVPDEDLRQYLAQLTYLASVQRALNASQQTDPVPVQDPFVARLGRLQDHAQTCFGQSPDMLRVDSAIGSMELSDSGASIRSEVSEVLSNPWSGEAVYRYRAEATANSVNPSPSPGRSHPPSPLMVGDAGRLNPPSPMIGGEAGASTLTLRSTAPSFSPEPSSDAEPDSARLAFSIPATIELPTRLDWSKHGTGRQCLIHLHRGANGDIESIQAVDVDHKWSLEHRLVKGAHDSYREYSAADTNTFILKYPMPQRVVLTKGGVSNEFEARVVYRFRGEEDYQSFARNVSAPKRLLVCADVLKIKGTKPKDREGQLATVQLWEDGGAKFIQYCSNMKDRKICRHAVAEFLPPKYEEGYVRMDGNSIPPGGDRQVLRLKFGKLEHSNLFIREVKGPQSGPLTQYPKMLLIGPP